MSKFDWIDEKDEVDPKSDETKKASFLSLKELQKSTHKINRLKDLTNLPGINESQYFFVNSQFDAIHFLGFILEHEKKIDILGLASYAYSRFTANILRGHIENGIIKKCILASTTSLRNRYASSYAIIESIKGDIITKYTTLHAKILLAKCGENYYVLNGSGNFTMNAKIEQYNFVNNKEVFWFFLNNINEIETKDFSRGNK